MKKATAIFVKTVITLLMLAPVLLLAVENMCMGPIKAPKAALVRTWDVEDNTQVGRLRFSFTIHQDGTVTGTVEAVGEIGRGVPMENACLKRTRHLFSKLLGRGKDYRVEGQLESSPVEECRKGFWIEFNCDNQGTMTRIKSGLRN